MTDKVTSIVPQLLCSKLARDLGRYLDGDQNVSPAEMLKQCNQILREVGDTEDAGEGVTR